MIKSAIVNFAYFLSSNLTYQNTKKQVEALLNDPRHPLNKFFVSFIVFLILSSVYILVIGVHHDLEPWVLHYDIYFVTTVFLIEYLLRLWVYSDIHKIIINDYENSEFLNTNYKLRQSVFNILKNKYKYLSSPMAVIDLLAIIPAYRPLRILRVFILFRVFKILRYTKNINQFFEVLKSKKIEFYTLGILLSFVVFTGGVTIYVFEGGINENIHNLFDAIYWALVTISTVGFGDIAPVTNGGKVASIALILSGIGIISFSTSLIVSSFNEKLDTIREERIISNNSNEGFVIICGYGQMSDILIRTLIQKKMSYILIEKDTQKYSQAVHKGLNVINEDATKHQAFSNITLDKAKALLAVTGDDLINIYITLNVRSLHSNIWIISRANQKHMDKKLLLAGANYTLKPYDIAGMMTLVYLQEAIAFEAMNAILTGQKNAHMEQITVTKESILDGCSLNSDIFAKNKLIFIGLFRNDIFIFNPDNNFILQPGDVIIVVGYIISLDQFKLYLHKGMKK